VPLAVGDGGGQVLHSVTSSIRAAGGDSADVGVTPPLSAVGSNELLATGSLACSHQASRCSLLRRASNDEARRAFFSPAMSPSMTSSVDDDVRWKKAAARDSQDAVKISVSQQFTTELAHHDNRL